MKMGLSARHFDLRAVVTVIHDLFIQSIPAPLGFFYARTERQGVALRYCPTTDRSATMCTGTVYSAMVSLA